MPGKADLIDAGLVGSGLVLIIGAVKGIPEGMLQTFLIILGFAIVIGDAILIEIMFEVMTMRYPYIRIELQPSGKILHCYLERKPFSKMITQIFGATTLFLHWPVEHPDYGIFKELVIHHELIFSKRVQLGPGVAVFQGYAIPHPQVGRIICHEYKYSGSDRFQDMSRPSFMLAYAHGGDVELVPLPLTTTFRALQDAAKANPKLGLTPTSITQILTSMKHYEAMTHRHLESTRESDYYRSETLRLSRGADSKDSQTKALLSVSTDAKKQAEEIVLDWHEVFNSIDNIVKKLLKRPRDWIFNKYTAMVLICVIGAVTLVFISLQPDVTSGMAMWFNENRVYLLISFIAIAVVGYLLFRRTKS